MFNYEIGIINVVDLLGGFYYVELFIYLIVVEVWKLIEEVEELGGMIKVVVFGMLKFRIEEVVVWK